MQSNEFQSLPQLSRPSTTGSMSRAPSREVNKALFSSVLTLKSTQDAKDFHTSYNIKSSTLNSLAIGDIIDSKKIPVFHGKSAEYEDICTVNKKSIATLASSSIFKTLGKYDPSVSVDKSNVRKVKRPRTRGGKVTIDDEEKNNKLSEALEMMAIANKQKNEASLSIFFSAGVIFDEIDIHVKAVEAFKKATRVVSPEYIVDTFLLPDDSVHKRKVERLGGKPLADYLYKRALKRETLLRDETERQRLRRIVAYCQLLRLYIILQNYKQSQLALGAAFSLCIQECEHNELLWYTHDLLKTNWNVSTNEVSNSYKIVKASAGSIAESHLRILHELLEIDGKCIDVLEWLGHRYTEKCDFVVAREYYKRARNVQLSNAECVRFAISNAEELTSITTFRRTAVSLKSAVASSITRRFSTEAEPEVNQVVEKPEEESAVFSALTITKSHAQEFSQGMEVDAQACNDRADYTRFTHKRLGSETVIYTPPEVGWESAADFAAYNYFRSREKMTRVDALRASEARKLKIPAIVEEE